MDQLQLKTKPIKLSQLGLTRWFFIISLAVFMLIECMSFFLLPLIDRKDELYFSFIFELLTFLALLLIFLLVQFAPLLSNKAHALLSSGLFLWILASIVDIADEFFYQPFWLSIWGEDVLRTVGIIVYTIGILSAIKSISINYSQIHELSIIDELTRLPNRRYFNQVVNRYEKHSCFLLLLDIDHFKKVNDLYGHEEGDIMLQALGNVLSTIMSNDIIAGRIGGEEFAILINSVNKHKAETLAERIMSDVREIGLNRDKSLSVSIGITMKKSLENSADALKRADDALYKAKNNGRDRFEWCD